MITTIGFEEMADLLNAQVAKYPAGSTYRQIADGDHTCAYFLYDSSTEQHKPACIVGHLVADLGYGPEDVVEGTIACAVLPRLSRHEFTNDALELATQAQNYQDGDMPWNTAVAQAIIDMETVKR
jgi:hypothetical protein